MKTSRLLIFFLLVSVGTRAQSFTAIDSMIQKAFSQLPQPGATVVVTSADKVLFKKAYGYADVARKQPATTQTLYYIASSTKSFTGLLATKLDAEGKIRLSDPVTAYKPFSGFKNKEVFEGVTVKDLLTHTSGLENEPLSMRLAYSGFNDPKEILYVTENYTKKTQEGKVFVYTNFGYYIYSLITEYHLKQSWKDLLKSYIFDPLQMDRTTAYVSLIEKQRWEKSTPSFAYGKSGLEEAKPSKKDNTMHAAGGLYTNGDNLANWLQMQLGKGKLNGKQVFDEKLILSTREDAVKAEEKRSRSFITSKTYGHGWHIGEYRDEPVVYHHGGYIGNCAHISMLPGKNIAVAVLVNESGGMSLANFIAQMVYDQYIDEQKSKTGLTERYNELIKQDSLNKVMTAAMDKKMSERTWKLSLPIEAYAGTYYSPAFGELVIAVQNGKPRVTMGNLSDEMTPFTETESGRLAIGGHGTVMQFKLKEKKVVSLVMMEEEFSRKN